MKHIVLLIILWCGFTSLEAQEKYYEIKLEEVLELDNDDIFFSDVIDRRIDTTKVGFVNTGLLNKRRKADLEGGVKSALLDFLNGDLVGPKKYNVTVLVHRMEVTEMLSDDSNDNSHCELELEFALNRNDSLYSIGVFDYDVYEGRTDVTASHGQRLSYGIQVCVDGMMQTGWMVDSTKLPLIKESKYNFDYTKLPKKAGYASFGQMARGVNVSGTDNLWLRKDGWVYKLDKETISDQSIRFITSSSNLYMQIGESKNDKIYIKSQQFGRYIYFNTYMDKSSPSLYFGLVGVAVEFAIGNGKKIPLLLDTETGEVTIFNMYVFVRMVQKKHPEILKFYKDSKRKLKDLELSIAELNKKFVVDK